MVLWTEKKLQKFLPGLEDQPTGKRCSDWLMGSPNMML